MQKIKFSTIIRILFYIMVFFILLNNSLSYLDPDFGWHLKVGEQILNERAVPNMEIYNYPLEDETWVDHEWLLNTTVYWIYTNWGYMALNILFVLVIIATLLILNIIIYKYITPERDSFILIIIFELLGVIASQPHLGVRMQEITLLNLALLLLIIYHYNKHKNIKPLLFLPLLFYFWANAHAGFLIGIFILFFWAGIKFVENIFSKIIPPLGKGGQGGVGREYFDYKNKLEYKKIFLFLLFGAISIGASFLTPYGLRLYYYIFDITNSSFMIKNIMEWLPFYILPIQYHQLLYAAFIALVIIFSLVYIFKKDKKISLFEILISILFFYLALKSKRHFPLFFIVSFPLLIKFFADFFDLPRNNFFNKKWRKEYFIVKPYIIAGILAVTAFKIIDINIINDPFVYFKNRYPGEAIQFLKNHPEYDNKKIFNDYGWGGYLVWAYPERKLFIDGRLPQHSLAGQTTLEEYSKFFEKEKTEEKLKQYNIELVLIPAKEEYYKLNWFEKHFLLLNEEKINDRENHLKNYLEDSYEWEVIFNDNTSNIYAKK